jgi:hypothetical protein
MGSSSSFPQLPLKLFKSVASTNFAIGATSANSIWSGIFLLVGLKNGHSPQQQFKDAEQACEPAP